MSDSEAIASQPLKLSMFARVLKDRSDNLFISAPAGFGNMHHIKEVVKKEMRERYGKRARGRGQSVWTLELFSLAYIETANEGGHIDLCF